MAGTGIQRKNRRSSTSRASALENAPRQSGAQAAARAKPAAAASAPARAGVAINGETNARVTLGKGGLENSLRRWRARPLHHASHGPPPPLRVGGTPGSAILPCACAGEGDRPKGGGGGATRLLRRAG